MPGSAAVVELVAAGDLAVQQLDHRGRRRVGRARRHQVLEREAAGGEVLHGQVQPTADQVLAHVADEVGQLERLAEQRRVRRRLRGRHAGGGAEDGQHHQPDDPGRALDVLEQVVVGLVPVDVEVHQHRAQERLHQRGVEVVPLEDRHQRPHRRVVRRGTLDGGAGVGRPVPQQPRVGRRHGVDELVGGPEEPVEGPDRRTAVGRQQPGREVVGAPVQGVQPPAVLDVGTQPRVGDARGVERARHRARRAAGVVPSAHGHARER